MGQGCLRILFLIVFGISPIFFSTPSLSDDIKVGSPSSPFLVRYLKKRDIKTLKIVQTEPNHIVMTINTHDEKSFRLKPISVDLADRLMKLLSEGKTIEITYPASHQNSFILADNWQEKKS